MESYDDKRNRLFDTIKDVTILNEYLNMIKVI